MITYGWFESFDGKSIQIRVVKLKFSYDFSILLMRRYLITEQVSCSF